MIASPKTCSAWLNDAMRALGELGITAEEITYVACYRSIPNVGVHYDALVRVCGGRPAEVNPGFDRDIFTVRFEAMTLIASVDHPCRNSLPHTVVLGAGIELEQPSVAHSPNDANSV